MTDILPKNPYPVLKADHMLSASHTAWQQGQDDTMKVLRPILENAVQLLQHAYDGVDEILRTRDAEDG